MPSPGDYMNGQSNNGHSRPLLQAVSCGYDLVRDFLSLSDGLVGLVLAGCGLRGGCTDSCDRGAGGLCLRPHAQRERDGDGTHPTPPLAPQPFLTRGALAVQVHRPRGPGWVGCSREELLCEARPCQALQLALKAAHRPFCLCVLHTWGPKQQEEEE